MDKRQRRLGMKLNDGKARTFPISRIPGRPTVSEKMTGLKPRTSSVQMAMEKVRTPIEKFTSAQLPWNIYDLEERQKIRELCRIYYMTHNLVPLAIDVYTRFPIQGIRIEAKDPDIQKFYEQLFFDQLNYKQFLIDVGREFFTVGEVNILATWNELLGIFEREEILNPDDITVTPSLFDDDARIHMKIPDRIKEIIETREPKDQYNILVNEYPEMIKAARQSNTSGLSDSVLGEGLEISNVLLSRIVNKSAPWDVYGTPHMMRAFTLLNLEESLYAAQKAIADRLYNPLILAKLGSPDLGDGEAWVPDSDDLDAFNDMMSQAMAADFRFLTYHYGVDIESVFGRESVPRFDQDFDRIESKMLEIWGIGESLIQGGSGGPYASSALNSEFVTQMMTSYQEIIQQHFKKRVEVVAEAQGHFDYNIVDGKSVPIMEEYIEIDDDGEEHVRKRPKFLLPELKFATMNTRDEATEREFLLTLKQAGIPISDAALMQTAELDFEEQLEDIAQEKVQKVLAEASFRKKIVAALTERGDPIPPELQGPVSMPIPDVTTNPVNVPNMTTDQQAMQISEQNAQQAAQQAPDSPGAAPSMPQTPQASPPPAPQLSAAPALPSNWISQRPSISDNMRAGMPKGSNRKKMLRKDPSVIGMRNGVSEEEAAEVIQARPWKKALRDFQE
jgi:hypothetical protein